MFAIQIVRIVTNCSWNWKPICLITHDIEMISKFISNININQAAFNVGPSWFLDFHYHKSSFFNSANKY